MGKGDPKSLFWDPKPIAGRAKVDSEGVPGCFWTIRKIIEFSISILGGARINKNHTWDRLGRLGK